MDYFLTSYFKIVVFPVDGLCQFYQKALTNSAGQFVTSSAFTPNLLTPTLLNNLVQSQLQNTLISLIGNLNQQLSLLELHGVMDIPLSGVCTCA